MYDEILPYSIVIKIITVTKLNLFNIHSPIQLRSSYDTFTIKKKTQYSYISRFTCFKSLATMWKTLSSLAKVTILPPTFIVTLHQFGWINRVDGESMQPTFNPRSNIDILVEPNYSTVSKENATNQIKYLMKRDFIYIDKWSVRDKSKLRVGDIVVCISPTDPNGRIVKRIAAMPGDVIQFRDTDEVLMIKPGHCWLEGDNPLESRDSLSYGQVPLGLIVGKASYIVWPYHRMGRIESITNESNLDRKVKLVSV